MSTQILCFGEYKFTLLVMSCDLVLGLIGQEISTFAIYFCGGHLQTIPVASVYRHLQSMVLARQRQMRLRLDICMMPMLTLAMMLMLLMFYTSC